MLNPSVREGWGLVNIEAAWCGTPVVGYRVPGVKDSVVQDKTGILVDKNDTKVAAQAIIDLAADEKRYMSLSENSRKWAKKFSWKKAGEQSLELIKSI